MADLNIIALEISREEQEFEAAVDELMASIEQLNREVTEAFKITLKRADVTSSNLQVYIALVISNRAKQQIANDQAIMFADGQAVSDGDWVGATDEVFAQLGGKVRNLKQEIQNFLDQVSGLSYFEIIGEIVSQKDLETAQALLVRVQKVRETARRIGFVGAENLKFKNTDEQKITGAEKVIREREAELEAAKLELTQAVGYYQAAAIVDLRNMGTELERARTVKAWTVEKLSFLI
jgi:cytochrome c556